MAKTKANEPEFQSQVISWIKEQISHGGLPFENATGDSSLYGLETVRFPDVLLTLDFACQRPFCGWELKTPTTDVRDAKLLKDAVEKAQTLKAKYFVTWNMQTAIIWRTPAKTRTTVKEKDKVREFGPDARIQSVDDIRDLQKSLLLQSMCAQLLRDLARLHKDENINLPVADTTVFVGLVANASEQMAGTLLKDINKSIANKDFNKKLNAWAKKQGVNKYDQDYRETLSQQIAYKIIGKIMFYMTLRRHNLDLPRMELPPKSYKTAIRRMRELFQQALEVDYQAIFEPDITDEIDFSSNTAKIIIQLTEHLAHWSFELMPLDVIGNVFEKLIPEDARHSLGQYFTPNNLVDLIVTFCVRNGEDCVMDPTCGTGTFLIRGYNKLRGLSAKRKTHHELLSQVWGFDIAGFPAELATINLFRQDFSDYRNFPRVLSKDFFDVLPGQSFEFPPPKRTAKTGELVKEKIPKFDVLVGNFPFIRQEKIEKAERGYKKKLESVLYESWGKEYPLLFKNKIQGNNHITNHILQLSGQADIYAYLFFHAASHLKNGGRMGFVTSNSWLDVAYGYELQRFFLSKFKVIAICESRCEPWFEQSAVNTVFTILERSDEQEANKNNFVRFVKLKKTLAELFPQDASTDAQARWIGLDKFVEKIETSEFLGGDGCKNFAPICEEYVRQPEIISYEDEEVRIRMIRQGDLADEAAVAGQTVKWGQYLRAPDIYFEILRECADKFVPLGEIVDIRRGITTGINKFFYLTEDEVKHWGIERKFLKPVIESPKECDGIKLKEKDLKLYAFLCHKDKSELKGTKALKYIQWAQSQKTKDGNRWMEVPTVSNRMRWYELPKRESSLVLLPAFSGNKLRCILNFCNAQVDNNLFEIVSKDKGTLAALGIYLNSAGTFIQKEIIGRIALGDGALKLNGIDWKRILVPEKDVLLNLKKNAGKAFEKLCKRSIKDIKTEAKRKDRIEFEKEVLKSLGLPEELGSQILAGVVGLVEERYLLPKLRTSKKKKRVAQDYAKLCEEVSDELLPNGPVKFPEGFVRCLSQTEYQEIGVPQGELKLGESFFDNHEICDAEGQHLMEVASEVKGKFIVYAKKKDELVLKVPKSRIVIKKAVQEYEIYIRDLSQKLYTAFMEKCGDHLRSENLTRQIFEDFGIPYIR
ncbi:MAG TPA: N-6 DNA methylase [Planctomycetes bacterium]|nr:N-6 DNA methylase [Planctomycetota bacterium]